MTRISMYRDDLGRIRALPQMADPAVAGVNALIQGLRAAQAELNQQRCEARQAVKAEKARRRQETRTKLTAFVLFDLMSACMLYAMWAGING